MNDTRSSARVAGLFAGILAKGRATRDRGQGFRERGKAHLGICIEMGGKNQHGHGVNIWAWNKRWVIMQIETTQNRRLNGGREDLSLPFHPPGMP